MIWIARILTYGCWILVVSYCMMDTGCWLMLAGCWLLIVLAGYCLIRGEVRRQTTSE